MSRQFDSLSNLPHPNASIGEIIPNPTNSPKTSRIASIVSTCPCHPNFRALSMLVAQLQLIVSENCSEAHMPSALPDANGSEARLYSCLRSSQADWTAGSFVQAGREKEERQ